MLGEKQLSKMGLEAILGPPFFAFNKNRRERVIADMSE
jgi:hypothetical protein